jgi:hypothetical protein
MAARYRLSHWRRLLNALVRTLLARIPMLVAAAAKLWSGVSAECRPW